MKFAAQTIWAVIACISLSHGEKAGPDFLVSSCGLSRSRPRIVGAHLAPFSTTPWMAMIIGQEGFLCGGSLITNRFVLSAAHCLDREDLKVRLGEYDRSTQRDCMDSRCLGPVQEFDVDAVFQHQGYDELRHDLGLLRLATRVWFTDYIRPICVLLRPSIKNLEDYVVKFRAYGWGTTEYENSSQILLKTTLYNLDRSVCARQFPNVPIDRDHICAERDGASTCTGDSGGPLAAQVLYEGQEKVIQFGIVSFGKMYCENATVATNVMAHLDWIRNTVRLGKTL